VNLTSWQWLLLALGAFFTGLSKTGVAGLGVLPVALFANALPARASTVPFSARLGLISPGSLALDALLVIPMIPGALLGPVILRHINQRAFELMVLVLTVAAALRLLV